jgi:chorismate mutase / prephenate dehydrogenase
VAPRNADRSQDSNIDALRSSVLRIDEEIVSLIAKRLDVVSRIGRRKRQENLELRDFARERIVLENALSCGTQRALPGSLTQTVFESIMAHSLAVQERDIVMDTAGGSGKSALIIGGKGKIGNWFVRFLSSQGFQVQVADPQVGSETELMVRDWRSLSLNQDVIIVAVPLGQCAAVLTEIAERRPEGLLFDVASLKSPLKEALSMLHRKGCRVTSVHPMFGPDTEMLSGRHVIFLDVGHREATACARNLFAGTMAHCVEMTLDAHDQLMAHVLGLTHLLNIAFCTALRNSGEEAERLQQISSTSFEGQIQVTHRISMENPHLYYEIQRLNPFRKGPQQALTAALAEIIETIESGDEAAFVRIMETGNQYLQTLPDIRERRERNPVISSS